DNLRKRIAKNTPRDRRSLWLGVIFLVMSLLTFSAGSPYRCERNRSSEGDRPFRRPYLPSSGSLFSKGALGEFRVHAPGRMSAKGSTAADFTVECEWLGRVANGRMHRSKKALFDHFVSAREQQGRQLQTELPCSFLVHDKLKFR